MCQTPLRVSPDHTSSPHLAEGGVSSVFQGENRWLILNNVRGRNGLLGLPDSKTLPFLPLDPPPLPLGETLSGTAGPLHIRCLTNCPRNLQPKATHLSQSEWIRWGLAGTHKAVVLNIYKEPLKARTIFNIICNGKMLSIFSFRLGTDREAPSSPHSRDPRQCREAREMGHED